MKKRLLSILLILMLVLGMLPTMVFAADLPFTDVPKNAWYYSDVESAVASGLVNGKSATTYAPDDNLTYAEAVKLAACMYQKSYEGAVTLTNGSPWYQSYVDYAKQNGIIIVDYNWTAKATRGGYMEIFANALKPADLAPINTVTDGSIPDISMSAPAAKSIYTLYRAGILQGSDDIHSCKPYDNIKRSEVAAILTRMMNPSKRLSFSLGAVDAPLTITQQPQDTSTTEGGSTSLSVKVSGGKAPYTYRWYVNTQNAYAGEGAVYNGTETATLTFKQTPSSINGYLFSCIITDAEGNTVTSNGAMLTVTAAPLTITQQPANTSVSAGETAIFTVAVSGGKAPYTYTWWCSGNVQGIGNTYAIDANTNTYAGSDYFDGWNTGSLRVYTDAECAGTYWCIITDAAGNTVTSNKVTLTVK